MRAPAIALALWLMAGGAFLAAAPPEKAPPEKGDTKKADTVPLKIDGELTKDDAKDTVRKNSHAKTHEVKLAAGKRYQIDMKSSQIDSYLRLEDPSGKQVAEDDDSGGFPHARIVYKAAKDGTYKVIATTYKGSQTGKYTLTVKEASAGALALGEVQQEFQKVMQGLNKEFGTAKTDADREKIVERFFDLVAGNLQSLTKLAEKYAKDPVARQIQADLRGKLQMVGRSASPAVAKALRNLMEKSADASLKAQAGLMLGQNLGMQSEKAYQKKDKAGSVKLSAEAEALLNRVAKDHPGPLASQAEDALYLLKHLAVGLTAPDIAAEDIDGKKFKLSDYRGKVVVLDFWGNW